MSRFRRIARHWPALVVAVMFALWPMIAFAQDVTSNAEEVNGTPTNMIMWSAVVGFFLPAGIAVINRQRWRSEYKGICAFVICMIAAAGTAFFNGDLREVKDIATAALVVVFTAMGSYRIFWGPQATNIAPRIEAKTG